MRFKQLKLVTVIIAVFLFVGALGVTILRIHLFSDAHAQAQNAPAAAELATRGAVLFKATCAGCHLTDSTAAKGGPGLKGLFKAPKLPASGKPVTDEDIAHQLKKPFQYMPAFPDLTDEQVKSLIAYLKTL